MTHPNHLSMHAILTYLYEIHNILPVAIPLVLHPLVFQGSVPCPFIIYSQRAITGWLGVSGSNSDPCGPLTRLLLCKIKEQELKIPKLASKSEV